MSLGFPQQGPSQRKGRAGEAWFESFVCGQLGWVYRPVHGESDWGVDGYVEVVDRGSVTGRGFAVQIKCGDSYVARSETRRIVYQGSVQHLNYYMNQPMPVVLVLLSEDCTEGFWAEFDANRTTRGRSGWSLEVPRSNRLDKEVRESWAKIAGPPQDFTADLEQMWAIDELLTEVSLRSVAVPQEDVELGSVDFIKGLIARFSKTRESLLRSRGTLEVFFRAYDDDPREVYEIPEVRRWFEASIDSEIPWFYFLNTDGGAPSLRLLLFATCAIERESSSDPSKRLISVSGEDQARWLERNFLNLNRFAESYGVPEEIVREVSFDVMRIFGIPVDEFDV